MASPRPLDVGDEAVEDWCDIVGPGARFGVTLETEGGCVAQLDALQGAIEHGMKMDRMERAMNVFVFLTDLERALNTRSTLLTFLTARSADLPKRFKARSDVLRLFKSSISSALSSTYASAARTPDLFAMFVNPV